MTLLAGGVRQWAESGRWAARIVGSLMFLFLLAFVFGEGIPPVWRMSSRDQLYGLGLACLFFGLIVAWFREGWGGLVTLAGWAMLAALAGKPLWAAFFFIPAATGAVHLLCWWALRDRPASMSFAGPLGYLAGAVSVFVLLCANEIFGMPPLMTPSGPPPRELVGTWGETGGHPAAWIIAADGAVSGEVLGDRLSEAHLEYNRSWFGRLMHWRTDYLVRGSTAEGRGFLAPVTVNGNEMQVSVSFLIPGRPGPVRLRLQRREY